MYGYEKRYDRDRDDMMDTSHSENNGLFRGSLVSYKLELKKQQRVVAQMIASWNMGLFWPGLHFIYWRER